MPRLYVGLSFKAADGEHAGVVRLHGHSAANLLEKLLLKIG
jgi:hypothetical protein